MGAALPDIWLTAGEIAGEALPGLPGTTQRVSSLAIREDWRSKRGARRRTGSGGGWEYHISVLPPEAQRALIARRQVPVVSDGAARKLAIVEEMETLWTGSGFGKDAAVREIARRHGIGARTLWGWLSAVAAVPRGERLAALGGMEPERSAEVGEAIEARLDALPTAATALKSYQREAMQARMALLDRQAGPPKTTDTSFSKMLSDPDETPELRRLVRLATEGEDAVSVRTLERWRHLRRKGGDLALAPVPRRKARSARPDWADAFLSFYARPTKPSVSWAYEEMLKAADGGKLPSLRSVTRWVQSLGAVEKARGRVGRRELKSIRAHVVRDISGLLPTDVYTADGHTLDMEVLHPATGRPFRPEMTSVLDVATRRCVGWSVGLAECAHGVADAHRRAFESGVSAIIYVDNGSGFKNNYLDDAVNGVLARAGSEKQHSLPYGSQARGVIERFNATCWIRATKALPGYVGADMDPEARQIVFRASRKDAARSPLMDWPQFMAWAEATVGAYNTRPHSTLPKIVEDGKKRHQSPDERWADFLRDGFEAVLLDPETALDLWRPYEMRQVRRGCVQINGGSYFSRALDLGDFHGATVRVGYDIHDPSRVWVRDFEDRLICVAELDGNKTPYFPASVVEKARETRAKAQIKRLDAKRQEKLAQTRGGLDYQPVEAFTVPLAVEKDPVPVEPPFTLPDDPAAKYRIWQQLDQRLRDGGAISDREAGFHRSFERTADFRVAMKLERKAAEAAKKEGTA